MARSPRCTRAELRVDRSPPTGEERSRGSRPLGRRGLRDPGGRHRSRLPPTERRRHTGSGTPPPQGGLTGPAPGTPAERPRGTGFGDDLTLRVAHRPRSQGLSRSRLRVTLRPTRNVGRRLSRHRRLTRNPEFFGCRSPSTSAANPLTLSPSYRHARRRDLANQADCRGLAGHREVSLAEAKSEGRP